MGIKRVGDISGRISRRNFDFGADDGCQRNKKIAKARRLEGQTP